jgi:tight adherence protein C
MITTIFTFGAVFLLVLSAGLLVFYRDTVLSRISDVIHPRPKQKTLFDTIQETGVSIGAVVEHFEQVLPKSQAEVSVVLQRLIRAGYRDESSVKIFYGCKVLVPLVLCALALASGVADQNPFFIYVSCLGVGFLLPDFWLGRKIIARQSKIRRGLPDVLDLLTICIEAGLSMDQATARAAKELTIAQPELCDELNVVVLEQHAGRPRADSWRHLSERTGVDCVRNFVSMLVQAEQFGTSVARTIRIQSTTLRTQRVQAVEEMAAKTSVKLVFPLVLFIFPALFLVVLGPAFISMADQFKILNH